MVMINTFKTIDHRASCYGCFTPAPADAFILPGKLDWHVKIQLDLVTRIEAL